MTEPITDKRLSLMRAMAKDDTGWHWGTADVQEMIARIDRAEATIARVKEARAGHPSCGIHKAADVLSCGWKSAVRDIDEALEGATDD